MYNEYITEISYLVIKHKFFSLDFLRFYLSGVANKACYPCFLDKFEVMFLQFNSSDN